LTDVRTVNDSTYRQNAAPLSDVVNPDDPEAQVVERILVDPSFISFQRAALLARALVDGGAPPGGLSTGLKEGLGDVVRIRFDILPIDRSQVTFGKNPDEQPPDPSIDVIR